MENYIDPGIYGLHKNIILIEVNKNHIALIKKRKSRIIMSDGKIILNQINRIKEKQPDVKISLIISGPICSKTKLFLKDNNINIIE